MPTMYGNRDPCHRQITRFPLTPADLPRQIAHPCSPAQGQFTSHTRVKIRQISHAFCDGLFSDIGRESRSRRLLYETIHSSFCKFLAYENDWLQLVLFSSNGQIATNTSGRVICLEDSMGGGDLPRQIDRKEGGGSGDLLVTLPREIRFCEILGVRGGREGGRKEGR